MVRVPDCGSGCRGFKSHRPPQLNVSNQTTHGFARSGTPKYLPTLEQIRPRQAAESRLQSAPFTNAETESTAVTNKVFVVHGRDEEAKLAVARLLELLTLEAIILHERPDQGRTIIEKFE